MQSSRFQSRPPRRRRLQTKNYMRFLVLFQSTPPRRRRQCSILTIKVIHYFNPRLREGGDEEAEEENSNILISIHASAKEATWSVTITKNHRKNFNPRLREGGDYKEEPRSSAMMISIHASAKEATTNPVVTASYCITISIHASAKEATGLSVDEQISGIDFNPRLREGGDRNIL